MAITRTATPTSLPFTANGAQSFAHNCAANTSLLLLVIQTDAVNTISAGPFWNTSEAFTLIRDTGSGTAAGDVRQLVYGIVNPTAGNLNITFTVAGTLTVENIAFAVSYLGTVTSSVATAAIYVDEQINNAAATTVAMNEAVGGGAGRTAFAAATFFGGDGDPAAETASGGQFASPMFNSATGTSTTADRSYWVADQIGWTPAAVTVDWTGAASDECVGTVIELVPFVTVPAITSIDTDNDTFDARTGVEIVGTSFGASETGSAKVEIGNNATYASGTKVEVDVTSWSATSITVTLLQESDSAALGTLLSLPLSPAYLWVTDSAGNRNAAGFQFVLRPALPTTVAALNANATLDVDTTYHIVVRVANSGGAGGTGFKWRYNHASGGETDITTSSSVVRAVASSAISANDADLPGILGPTSLADNNAASEDGSTTLGAAFPAGGTIDFALAFQIRSADVTDEQTGTIRLTLNDGTPLGTYTNTFTYTVNEEVATTDGVGTAAGAGDAAAVGARRLAGAGVAPGVGGGSAIGSVRRAGAGSAPGVGAATGVGFTATAASGVGTAAGTGATTAVGVAAVVSAGAGTAAGEAAATAAGATVFAGVGTADGAGAATGVGATRRAGAGTAAAEGEASGVSVQTAAGVGTAAGEGTASAASETAATMEGIGSAAGIGAATAVSAATMAVVASATGTGTATASGAVIQPYLPVTVLATTNLQDTNLVAPPLLLADIQDDPAAPDGDHWTAVDPTLDTEARLALATPGGTLVAAQAFQVYVRKTAGATNPTVDVELHENGALVAVLVSGVEVTSTGGQLITVPWDASLLADPSGGAAEIRIVGHAA